MTDPTADETQAVYPTTVQVPVRTAENGELRMVTVVAHPTDTPGLVITPGLGVTGFNGSWALTHAASGYGIPVSAWDTADLTDVLLVAKALGVTPVDWTADFDSIRAQVTEHGEAIRAARRDARYPTPKPDGPDAPKDDSIAPYPRTDAQATADTIGRHVVWGAQHRCAETWKLVKRDDQEGRQLCLVNSAALVAEWALALLLREFAQVDRRAADHAARLVWRGWEDGETVHSQTWEWARGYGLPEVKDDEPAKAAGPVTSPEDVA